MNVMRVKRINNTIKRHMSSQMLDEVWSGNILDLLTNNTLAPDVRVNLALQYLIDNDYSTEQFITLCMSYMELFGSSHESAVIAKAVCSDPTQVDICGAHMRQVAYLERLDQTGDVVEAIKAHQGCALYQLNFLYNHISTILSTGVL